MFKALSNPNRLRIFLKLSTCCPPKRKGSIPLRSGEACACVGELGKDLGIVPSTVSHHIKELHGAGLIAMKRDGQTVMCSLEPRAVEELTAFFEGMNGG
jgi:ArsR family transcriptional regulator